MAGFRLFLLCFVWILSVVVGQIVQPGNGDLSVPSGYVWADVLTDGRTKITFGEITGDTLALTQQLTAGSTTLQNLQVTSMAVADLGSSTVTAGSLQTQKLNVWNPAILGGDVTISGNLHAGDTNAAATRTGGLQVQGTANIGGAVFAQSDVNVGGDLNIGGNGRFFGPATADSSLTVEQMVTVMGSASTGNWEVKGYTQTGNLKSSDQTWASYLWAQNMNVTGSVNITGDVQARGSLIVGKQVMAKSLNTSSSDIFGGNATVSGWIFGTSGTITTNANLFGWETIHGSLIVQGAATTNSNFTTNGTFSAAGNITSRSVMGVDSIFNNLNVDTSTIETVTATFVTATTLQSQDATTKNTFVVTGLTTLDTLSVSGASSLNNVNLVSLKVNDLSSSSINASRLNNTLSAVLTTVAINTSLAVGANDAFGYYASFQDAFTDNLTAVNLWSAQGNVSVLSGNSLNFRNITGRSATVTNFISTNATLTVVNATTATISTLIGNWANFTFINSTVATTGNISSDDANLMNLASKQMWTNNLNSDRGVVDNTQAGRMQSTTFQTSGWGNFSNLWSTNTTVASLTSTNSTIATLNSNTATTTWLWGKNLTYSSGTVTNIVSGQHIGNSASLNGFDAGILYAYMYANITDTETQTLRVTDSAWLTHNATIAKDLFVEGFSTFQSGVIAGDSVIAALTVVGDTLTSEVSVTGPAFLTDLSVKRMTITDQFQSASTHISNTTAISVQTSSNFTVGGYFNVQGDSRLGGNLVVQGTTQFQTGSFSRIGTALLTTTDMEAFTMNVASGLFGALTLNDLTVNRAAKFDRSISLVKMLSSMTSAPNSVFSSILPTTLTATQNGSAITIDAATVLHTGQATVDALVFTASNDSTVATLRVTGDGYLDFMGGSLDFDSLSINGIVFENENNVAWARPDAIPTVNLVRGGSGPFYMYTDLVDRDLVPPGSLYDPTRFAQPSDPAHQDLLTLFGGHYRVSGNIYFIWNAGATTNSQILARAGVNAYMGTQSSGSPVWTTDCRANFQTIAGSPYGGSCFLDGVIVVRAGNVMTLRTFAEWGFSSINLGNTLRVDPSSTLLVQEYFKRTSESTS